MPKHIITSGYKFVDIDAFACIFAYQELFKLKGLDVNAVITAILNASITQKYRKLDFYTKDASVLDDVEDTRFVIMDVSDPNQFERFVDINFVSEVFDHHPGFEAFWRDKIGEVGVIEPIGAAATLIVREYEKYGLLDGISPLAAELLAVAILSNTLFFQAKILVEEDRSAYETLKNHFSYTENFERDYFMEVQESIEKDMENALKDDSKSVRVRDTSLFIAQLEVWDAEHILSNCSDTIVAFMDRASKEIAFLNLIEIGKNKNVLLFRDTRSLEYMKRYFPEFEYDFEQKKAMTPNVILRKEILTRLYDVTGS